MKNVMSEISGSIDSAHDLLNFKNHHLSHFFNPQSVALVGASERVGSVGRSTFENLISAGFKGKIFPVNSARKEILGHSTFASIADIPEKIDLVVITTPAKTVPDIIKQCISKGIGSAVIISAGFKEAGPTGQKLEQEMLNLAKGKMRLLGPNCLGLMSPAIGLNATFAQTIAKAGNVAFISQSGALCTAILDWSLKESFGFSGFVSTGSMSDISWGDLIDYFGTDENTKSIVIYMESIGNARAFLSAAREVSLNKPIIVIKAGRTSAAAKAAASHTGTLTGSDDVLDVAFSRCGVLRVNKISEIFHMADVLGKQPLPQGNRLAIITNAGGPAVLATDALVMDGGRLSELSSNVVNQLSEFLPSAWSHSNPIDILGDAEPDRYLQTLKLIIEDPNSDGALVIVTPQGMTNPKEIASQLVPLIQNSKKPFMASWMGSELMKEGIEILNQSKVPTFSFPDSAVQTFNYMWKSRENLKMLYETPSVSEFQTSEATRQVQSELAQIRLSKRYLLSEFESKKILKIYGLPTVPTELALTADQAVLEASKIGFPVVLKIHSETITHKSDIGGVFLNLKTEESVRNAFQTIQSKVPPKDFLGVTVQSMISIDGYEVILGSSVDPQFGPVLLFGMGGKLVEVFKDRALSLPPLNTTLARRMMENTKIFKALLGVRGRKSVDISALEQILVRFSELVVNHPEISEIDINPLMVSENRIVALDARILLHPIEMQSLPTPAIRAYPSQYSWRLCLKNKKSIFVRAIRPEDEVQMRLFHEQLSEQTVYARYLKSFQLSERITHERLTRICFVDYDREIALVATSDDPKTGQIVASARLKKNSEKTKAELSIVVIDAFQGSGLGLQLMTKLVEVAKAEKLELVYAHIRSENLAMKSIFHKLGFKFQIADKGLLAYNNLRDQLMIID